MKKKLTIDQHFANAGDLDMAAIYINRVVERCAGLVKSGKAMIALRKLDPANGSGAFEAACLALEHEYLASISTDDRAFYGLAYHRCRAKRRR